MKNIENKIEEYITEGIISNYFKSLITNFVIKQTKNVTFLLFFLKNNNIYYFMDNYLSKYI